MKTRFAPSPTGNIHLGNIRIAFFNFLLSKKFSGRFFLRIENTDIIRSKFVFIISLLNIINKLDINYKYIYKQYNRKIIYNYYYNILQNRGFLYPCFCKYNILNKLKPSQRYNHIPLLYKCLCKKLNLKQIKNNIKSRKPHVLKINIINNKKIIFNDLLKKNPRIFFKLYK